MVQDYTTPADNADDGDMNERVNIDANAITESEMNK